MSRSQFTEMKDAGVTATKAIAAMESLLCDANSRPSEGLEHCKGASKGSRFAVLRRRLAVNSDLQMFAVLTLLTALGAMLAVLGR